MTALFLNVGTHAFDGTTTNGAKFWDTLPPDFSAGPGTGSDGYGQFGGEGNCWIGVVNGEGQALLLSGEFWDTLPPDFGTFDAINASLTCLGDVIAALATGENNSDKQWFLGSEFIEVTPATVNELGLHWTGGWTNTEHFFSPSDGDTSLGGMLIGAIEGNGSETDVFYLDGTGSEHSWFWSLMGGPSNEAVMESDVAGLAVDLDGDGALDLFLFDDFAFDPSQSSLQGITEGCFSPETHIVEELVMIFNEPHDVWF